MGNRACVVFTSADEKHISPAVYLHWNGGPESIYAFLEELNRRKAHGCPDYAAARFCHVAGDFFDMDEAGASSIGLLPPPTKISIDGVSDLAHTADDNGVFVVYPGGKVRRFVLEGLGKVKEMYGRRVQAERNTALKHEYNTHPTDSMAIQFRRLRPKVSEFG